MSKTIALLSGGLDSTVLLYHLKALGDDVSALGFHYGQRHHRELIAAHGIAAAAAIPYQMIDIRGVNVLLRGSSQSDHHVPVPDGRQSPETLAVTAVPNLPMILLACAGAAAISQRADMVAWCEYPGEQPTFNSDLAEAFCSNGFPAVEVVQPFRPMTKAQIVKRGLELGVPFASTWSCYRGLTVHCGRCPACIARREAFAEAGVTDPTIYVV